MTPIGRQIVAALRPHLTTESAYGQSLRRFIASSPPGDISSSRAKTVAFADFKLAAFDPRLNVVVETLSSVLAQDFAKKGKGRIAQSPKVHLRYALQTFDKENPVGIVVAGYSLKPTGANVGTPISPILVSGDTWRVAKMAIRLATYEPTRFSGPDSYFVRRGDPWRGA
jgi:hypothetical protein